MMMPPSRNFRRGMIVAAFVCAVVAIIDLTLHPLYARGIGQRWISHANGLSTMLSLPGLLLVVLPGLRHGEHTSTWVWGVMQALNFGVYTIGVAALLGTWGEASRLLRRIGLGSGARSDPAAEAASPREAHDFTREMRGVRCADAVTGASAHDTSPDAKTGSPRVTRRTLLLGGASGLAVGAVAVYPMSIATRHFQITRRTFGVRGLPPGLNGLRLVQLSDIHHGPWIPIEHVRTIVDSANALAPDLILLTGDYVHRSAAYVTPVVNALAKLRATIGIVGVLGNHDWWENGTHAQNEFARIGIPLIDNARRFVTPERQLVTDASEGLCLAGVGDLYTDEQRYDDALGGVPRDMPRLLLSHNPDVVEDPALRLLGHRVDLMLSGHTHGGQIYIPGLGTPVVPSRFGQKYARGLVQGPACPVFISRGLGHTVLPVRIGVKPEMAVIELMHA